VAVGSGEQVGADRLGPELGDVRVPAHQPRHERPAGVDRLRGRALVSLLDVRLRHRISRGSRSRNQR
jgi:hypothetical protein